MLGEHFGAAPDTVDEAELRWRIKLRCTVRLCRMLARSRGSYETAESASLFGKAGATEPVQEMIACRRIT